MKKQLLAFFLAVCMLGTIAQAYTPGEGEIEFDTYAIEGTGLIGKSYQRIETIDGQRRAVYTLVISKDPDSASQEFDMPNYANADNAPWSVMNENIKYIYIEDGVTGIGANAFSGMPVLEQVEIAPSVTKIGENAFSGNSRLKGPIDLSHVTTLGAGAFRGCSALGGSGGVTLNQSLTEIPAAAFSGTGLTSIDLPDNLVKIGDSAFSGCSFTELDFPDGVTHIGASAFSGSNLSVLNLPESLIEIGDSAFARPDGSPNMNLQELVIPENVEKIGASAFYNYQALRTVDVRSDKLTVVGDFAFGSGTHNAYDTYRELENGETAHVGTTFLTPNDTVKDLFKSGTNCYLGEVSPMRFLAEESTEPTCQTVGIYVYEYIYNNSEPVKYYREIDKLEHEWTLVGYVPATCERASYDLYRCDLTGGEPHYDEVFENPSQGSVPALGHNYQFSDIVNPVIGQAGDTVLIFTCQNYSSDPDSNRHNDESNKDLRGTIASTVLKADTLTKISELTAQLPDPETQNSTSTLVWHSTVSPDQTLPAGQQQVRLSYQISGNPHFQDGTRVDEVNGKQLSILVDVSKVKLDFSRTIFDNAIRYINVTKDPLTPRNLPAGVNPDYKIEYQDVTTGVWSTEAPPDDSANIGKPFKARVTFTYNSNIYELDPALYPTDSNYVTEDLGIDPNTKIGTVSITHDYIFTQFKFDDIGARAAENLIYNKNPQNTVILTNVPQGTTITYTWTDRNGAQSAQKTTGEGENTVYGPEITDAGEYTIHIKLENPNFTTRDDIDVPVKIAKRGIEQPRASAELTYEPGKTQTGVVSADESLYTVTNNSAVNAGTYYAEATLNDPSNYRWNGLDEGEATARIAWRIRRRSVTEPVLRFTAPTAYTGSPIEGLTKPVQTSFEYRYEGTSMVGYYNGEKVFTITEAYETNAGIYTPAASLEIPAGAETPNYYWAGHPSEVSFAYNQWEIRKRTIPSSESPVVTVTPGIYKTKDFEIKVEIPEKWKDVLTFVGGYAYYNINGEPLSDKPIAAGTYLVQVLYDYDRNNNEFTGENQRYTFQITPAPLTVTGKSSEEPYTGGTIPVPAPDVSGLLGDDPVMDAYTLSYTYDPTPDEPGDEQTSPSPLSFTDVGTYQVTVTLKADNYTAAPVTCTLTITKTDQSIVLTPEEGTDWTVEQQSITKNLGDADFYVTGQGALDRGAAVSYSVADGEPDVASVSGNGTAHIVGAGTEVIRVSAAETDNVNAAETTYTLTVNQADPGLTLAPQEFSYSGKAVEGYENAVLSGELPAYPATGKDQIDYTFYRSEQDAQAGQNPITPPTEVNTYWLRADYAGDTNYTSDYAISTVTIKPADMNVTVMGYGQEESKVYDGAAHPAATVTVTELDGSTEITDYTIELKTDPAGEYAPYASMPEVKNVSDSTTYYYRITAPNHKAVEDSFTVSIAPAPLTVTSNPVLKRAYDGTADTTVTDAAATSSATAGTETIAVTSASARFDNPNVGKQSVTVTYELEFASPDGYQNYTLDGVSALTGTTVTEQKDGEITPALLTVSLPEQSMVYNKSNTVPLAGPAQITAGVQNGETLTVRLRDGAVGEAAYIDAGAENNTVTVGTEQIIIEGATASNYAVGTVVCGNVTITPAPVTLRFNNDPMSAAYTGLALDSGVYAATIDGLIDGDSHVNPVKYTFYTDEGCTQEYKNDAIGNIPADVGVYGVKATLEAGGNYGGGEIAGKVEITPAEDKLQVSVTEHKGVYDANTYDAAKIVVSGDSKPLAEGEDYTITFATERGGEYKPGMPQVKHVLDSDTWYYKIETKNYGTAEGEFTVSITPAPLTIERTPTLEKPYDATTDAVVVLNGITGEAGSEVITGTVASASYNYPTVAEASKITVKYDLTTENAYLSDYSYNGAAIAQTADTKASVWETLDGTITAREVHVTGVGAVERDYDGSVYVELTGTPAGAELIESDDVGLALAADAQGELENASAGTGKTVTIGTDAVELTGEDKDNYTIVSVENASVTVRKAMPALTFTQAEQGVITTAFTNKPVEAAVYAAAASGVSAEDTPTGSITYKFYKDENFTQEYENAATGDIPVSAGTYYVRAFLTEEMDSNYESTTADAKLIINPAGGDKLSVTADGYGKTYDGAPHPAAGITVTADGRTLTEGVDYTVVYTDANGSEYTGNTTMPTVTNVADSATWKFKVSAPDYGEYEGQFTAQVLPAELTIVVQETIEKTYDADTTAQVSVSGDAEGEAGGERVTVQVSTAAYTDSAEAGDGKPVSVTYLLNAENADLSNYSYYNGSETVRISDTPGTASASVTVQTTGNIKPAPVTVTILKQSAVYDGAAPELGQAENDNWTVSGTVYPAGSPLGISLFLDPADASPADAGDHVIKGDWSNKNYAVTFAEENAVFTVLPREVQVEIGSVSGIYGEQPDVSGATLRAEATSGDRGLALGETIDDLRSGILLTATADAASDVGGSYQINGEDKCGNYAITFVPGVYTVKPRPVTVKVLDHGSDYGTPIDGGIASPVAGVDYEVSSTLGTAVMPGDELGITLKVEANAQSPAADYPIMVEALGADKDNYAITFTGDSDPANGIYTIRRAKLSIAFANGSGNADGIPIGFAPSYDNLLSFYNVSNGGAAVTAEDDEALRTLIRYESDNPEVAEVDANGTVTIHQTGTVRITASIGASDNFEAAESAWYILHIAQAGGGIQVQFPYQSLTYTGQAQPLLQEPTVSPAEVEVTIQYSLNNVDWSEEIPQKVDAGTYAVYYKASANGYADVTGQEHVTIAKAIPAEEFTAPEVRLEYSPGLSWDGAQHNPLILLGTAGTDYTGTIEYRSEDVTVARAVDYGPVLEIYKDGATTITAILSGDDNYEGAIVSYELIVSKAGSGIQYTAEKQTVTYDGAAHGSNIQVTAPQAYTVYYSLDDGISYDSTVSPTFTDAGTHTVKFRIVADGYDAVNGTQTIEILPKEIELGMFDGSVSEQYTYIGSPIEPPVTVTYNGMALEEGIDYTVTYGPNTEVGPEAGTVTVTGVDGSNYTGSQTVTFEIVAVRGNSLSGSLDRYYGIYGTETNNAEVTVKYGQRELRFGEDYTLTCHGEEMQEKRLYFDEVGVHEIIIKGIGNYSGVAEVVLRFSLLPQTGDDGGLQLTVGGEPSPRITTYGDPTDGAIAVANPAGGADLIEGTDYTLSYTYYDNLGSEPVSGAYTPQVLQQAGMYVVTATAMGGYTGTGTFVFLIQQRALSDEAVTVEVDGAVYTGGDLTPGFTAEYQGLLTEADYDAVYQNNRNAGTGQLILTAKKESNNFTGTTTRDFAIAPKPITEAFTVDPIPNQTYTGQALTPALTVRDETGTPLSEMDYRLEYHDNTEIGTGYVNVIGRGNYTGTITDVPFSIVASGSVFDLTVETTQWTYDGNANAGNIAVTYNGNPLNIAVDYTLSIARDGGEALVFDTLEAALQAMVEPGVYTVTATGIGSYANTSPDSETVTVHKIQPVITVTATPESLSGSGNITLTVKAENLPEGVVLTQLEMTKNGEAEKPLTLTETVPGSYTAVFEAPNANATYVFFVSVAETDHYASAYAEAKAVTATKSVNTGGPSGSGTTTYTVSFDTQGGSEIASQKVNRNNTAVQPVDPIREGYRFMGWFTDQTCTQAYDFTERVTKNLTLYAAWEEIPPEPVDTVTHMPYLLGYEDGTFRPEGNITRAEAAAIFARLLAGGADIPAAAGSAFVDVDPDAWYYDSVNYLQQYGIIVGQDETHFAPDAPITRAEFVTICTRFDAYVAVDTVNDFTDVEAKHWAYAYINYAVHEKWIEGYEDGTFRPDAPITRAEAVSVVNRVLGRSADQEYIDAHKDEMVSFPDLQTNHWAYYDIMEAALRHDCVEGEDSEQWQ